MSEPTSTSATPRTSPFTIALLFYVVTLGGIVSACLRTLIGNEFATARVLVTMLVAGAVFGLIFGAATGVIRFRTFAAALIGAGVGTVIGSLAGSLALVSGQHFSEIALTAFGGCWVLVLLMLAVARFTPDGTP